MNGVLSLTRRDESVGAFALTSRAREALTTVADADLGPDVGRLRLHGWRVVSRTAYAEKVAAHVGSGEVRVAGVWRSRAGGVRLVAQGIVVIVVDGPDDECVEAELVVAGIVITERDTWEHRVYFGRCERPFEVAERLMELPWVCHAQPEVLQPDVAERRPGSSLEGSSWHLRAMQCADAWSVTEAQNVRIAVIDAWFDRSHEDLRDAYDPRSAAASVSPLGQVTFHSSLSIPGVRTDPERSHGTSCAGMAVARRNGCGGIGVAPRSRLIAVAHERSSLPGQSMFARMIRYAVRDAGGRADVVSCSVTPSREPHLEIPLAEAIDHASRCGRNGYGTPILWAAPNDGAISTHPLAYHDDVVMVGRTKELDGIEVFDTRFDTDRGDLVAPGSDVAIAVARPEGIPPDSGYDTDVGTSYATGSAAGVAALVLGVNPRLRWDAVRTILLATCDKIGTEPYVDGRNRHCGHGRVNAARAVELARRWR